MLYSPGFPYKQIMVPKVSKVLKYGVCFHFLVWVMSSMAAEYLWVWILYS